MRTGKAVAAADRGEQRGQAQRRQQRAGRRLRLVGADREPPAFAAASRAASPATPGIGPAGDGGMRRVVGGEYAATAAASGWRPRAAQARSTSLATPSPTIAAVSAGGKPASPRAAISRFSAAVRSGTVSTSVPSRSSSRVRVSDVSLRNRKLNEPA